MSERALSAYYAIGLDNKREVEISITISTDGSSKENRHAKVSTETWIDDMSDALIPIIAEDIHNHLKQNR